MREFRFGITNSTVADPAGWTAAAREAESLGYATFLLPDTTNTPPPLIALCAAATATTTLHVGTWVLCDPLRNPRQLAWEAAGLQQLCGGRFELGVGAGRPGAEHDAAKLGVPFDSAGRRVERLGETVALLRAELPDTPIMIAASGPRLLALAGRSADIVALGWPPATTVDDARARIDVVRSAAGDRDVELAAGLIALGDVAQPWLSRMGVELGELHASGAVTVLRGTPVEMADELQRRRDALGVSYVTVPSNVAREFAPVVELLAGR